MIPVILYLLILAYALLVVGIIWKVKIMEILASFFLLILAVEIITNGIGTIENVMTSGIGIINIGIGGFHLVKDLTNIDFSNKLEEEED